MGLAEFMQLLQEQSDSSDLIFSQEPDPVTKVIPPSSSPVIKAILPEEQEEPQTIAQPQVQPVPVQMQSQIQQEQQVQQTQTNAKPKIQLKLKLNNKTINLSQLKPQNTQPTEQVTTSSQQVSPVPPNQDTPTRTIIQPEQIQNVQILQQEQEVKQVPQIEKSNQQQALESSIDELTQLFINSGTESSKKAMWTEYYQKAKSSRKQNPIVERMKLGKFMITFDNKVLILPDYDVVHKDPDDILKDHWF